MPKDPKEKDSDLTPDVMQAAVIDALRSLPPDELGALLKRAGVVPTTSGMGVEHLQAIMSTMDAVSARSVKEALRSERKENPNYPEKSVFFPAGKFDDSGRILPAKITLSRTTFFNGVRLGGELETEEEIGLCNRFTESRTAREGEWQAIVETGLNARLTITVPSKTVDDRMSLPPFTHILRELLDGAEAVNPDTMARRIAALEAQMKAMGVQPLPAV